MNNVIKGKIDKILKDKTSGSTEILLHINKLLLYTVKHKIEIAEIIERLQERLAEFSSVMNYLNGLKDKDTPSTINYINSFENKLNDSIHKIYSGCREIFTDKNTIFILSNSYTLLEVIKLLHKENINLKVVIAESRPELEGRILARKLIKDSIDVRLVIDFDSARGIEQADAVVIGADKIFPSGSIVNKTGSRNAAILCKYFNKPFYVVSSKNKLSADEEFTPQEKNPDGIWSYRHNNLTVKNYYFELIEKELITKIVTG